MITPKQNNQRVSQKASYYETCKSCKHVFKPQKLNRRLIEDRECCPCCCHWGGQYDPGITLEEAKILVTLRRIRSA